MKDNLGRPMPKGVQRELLLPKAAKSGKVVFSVTAAQLYVLRAIADGVTKEAKHYAAARRDPRWSLVSKGLVEHIGADRFALTPFGQAIYTWVR